MYTGIRHTHVLVVSLFLLLYIIKFGLLMMGKKELLAKFSKVTRIPEMVISFLFLATGGYLLFKAAAVTNIMIIKLLLVFGSIPLAVMGFKKSNKVFAGIAVLMILMAYGFSEMDKIGAERAEIPAVAQNDPLTMGKVIFAKNCVTCHETDGKSSQKLSGAKDITATKKTDTELKALLQKGKNSMPAYAKTYNDAELDAVLTYIKTLK